MSPWRHARLADHSRDTRENKLKKDQDVRQQLLVSNLLPQVAVAVALGERESHAEEDQRTERGEQELRVERGIRVDAFRRREAQNLQSKDGEVLEACLRWLGIGDVVLVSRDDVGVLINDLRA